MISSEPMADSADNDIELVALCRAGSPAAFGQIVSRYQSLICSIAYSATGSLSGSEDTAQETFLTAWRRLGDLREPAKLRPWLCGIARNLVQNRLRRERREPVHGAEPLDQDGPSYSPEPPPSEEAIRREEEALLWRSLEQIPAAYREPLVLFYREDQSVARVALALDLSEEAVRQRLSRGRRLLQERARAMVEGVLRRSSPGRAFTIGVIAALPVLATSASAATAGAAAKGGMFAKSAGFLALFHFLLGPVIGLLGAYVGVRAGLKSTRTPRERQYVVNMVKVFAVASILLTAGVLLLVFLGIRFWQSHPALFLSIGMAIPLLYVLWLFRAITRCHQEMSRLRVEELELHPELFREETAAATPPRWEYRSETELFGLPLVRIRCGTTVGERPRRAVGWIALGDRAVGLLFAMGGTAVGGISIGGGAVGVISVGGASVGLLSVGGVSLGFWALGGLALGIQAVGGFGCGWTAAAGGLATAREFALGGLAVARHANDQIAREFWAGHRWFNPQTVASRQFQTLVVGFWILSMFPAVWHTWRKRHRAEEGRARK